MADSRRIIKPVKGNVNRINTLAPQIGIVKSNIDSENMGRLKVWIKGSNSNEEDPNGWITCSYSSPFAGASDPETLGNDPSIEADTQKSYGFWGVPPDNNNLVIVQFINGDIKQAFWTGCLYQKNMNYMVPGIAAGSSYQNDQYGGAPPVVEYNKLGSSDRLRPAYSSLAEGLRKQGLINDPLRGAGSSSARRESPSKVFGLSTPGGNQFVMDDGVDSELIRLRTKSGAQILLSETDGSIYFINRDGTNWVELGSDGNLDFYAGAGFNVHAIGDINLKAGGNVNIEGGTVNLKAKDNLGLISDSSLTMFSAGNTTSSVHGRYTTVRKGDEQTFRFPGQYTIYYDTLPHPSISVVDNSPPGFPLPATSQQSIKGNTTQESPVTGITTRVPDSEPWEHHATVARVERDSIEESTNSVKKGSVSASAISPLPVVGSPTKGMKSGVYSPKGYDKKGQPEYTFVGTTTESVPVNTLTTSKDGIALLTTFEGYRSTKYPDGNGFAIGYGHTIKPTDSAVVRSGIITREIALELLAEDLKYYESFVRKYVTVPLTQAQFDALVSFTYNTGPGSPKQPKGLYRLVQLSKLNEGNYSEVPNTMMLFVTGRLGADKPRMVLDVLKKRRREEGLRFATPVSTNS